MTYPAQRLIDSLQVPVRQLWCLEGNLKQGLAASEFEIQVVDLPMEPAPAAHRSGMLRTACLNPISSNASTSSSTKAIFLKVVSKFYIGLCKKNV